MIRSKEFIAPESFKMLCVLVGVCIVGLWGSVTLTNAQNTNCGSSCVGTHCSGSYYTGSTCVDGRCMCLNNPNRDQCTCLAIVGSCHITQGASVRVGTPTYTGNSQTTYSCIANDNCNYDVHVIANYESNGHSGFRIHNTGNTNVNLAVTGTSSKPLILVFVSYEPVRWILTIPSGVVIDRIILSSYYIDRSSVLYTAGQVVTLERNTYQNLPCAYGPDGGCRTLQVLQYLHRRFGPVSSFTGSYRADSWTLGITQQNTSDCISPTTAVGATSLTTAGCSAIVCGPVVAVAVVIVIVSIIMAATFIIIKRKQHLDTSNPSYNNTPAAASNSPWDGVVPATPTPNPEHVGYWVARVGWVQGDKSSGRDESAEQCTDRWNEGCVSPPPQYEGCVSPPPQYEEL